MPECELVLELEGAQGKIEAWRREYNESRSHAALAHMPPAEFGAWDGASPPRGSTEPGDFTFRPDQKSGDFQNWPGA